ncbi:hypothetical protein ACFY4C_41105 [Actinomadura viridis]|uniref:hypothetical protein n=1 Tax=Actinomadura viridis TaxID=58110 RepID=UPI0036C41A19
MPTASVEYHDPIGDGPVLVDFYVRLTGEDLEAMGNPGAAARADLTEFSHAAIWGLILLRTLEREGEIQPRYADPAAYDVADTRAALRGLIGTLERKLLPRMLGIRDAAVRWHSKLGGSHGDLADAMGVARSTAQTRTQALLAREPSEGERWALGARPAREAGPARHRVTLELDDDAYFAVTDALRDWAWRQRGEAEEEMRDDPGDTTAQRRLAWAKAAETTLHDIQESL